MASSKTPMECCICTEEYNRTTHRPRGLPCLHNFCSPCLQTCITQGRTECSICRKPYTAARVEDIPINNALEEMIEMYLQLQFQVPSLKSNQSAQPIVYLDLQAQGQQLGRIRIRLSCGPQRRQQMVRLCSGTGGDTLRGMSFTYAWNVGEPGEFIRCPGYLRSDGSTASAFTVTGPVEQDQCKVFVAGAVTGHSDDTGFFICTTTAASNTDMRPELGQVITGLDILSQAIRKYAPGSGWSDASQIQIVECGVEMPN